MNGNATERSETDTPTTGSGRPLLLTLGIGSLAVAILLVAFWAAAYEPLEYGTYSQGPQSATHTERDGESAYAIDFKPAGEFSLVINLVNDGPLPVTVNRFQDDNGLFHLVSVETGNGPGVSEGLPPRSFSRFTPQKVHSGKYVAFRLTYEFADCELESGATTILRAVAVEQSFTFFDSITWIDLSSPVLINNTMGVC